MRCSFSIKLKQDIYTEVRYCCWQNYSAS